MVCQVKSLVPVIGDSGFALAPDQTAAQVLYAGFDGPTVDSSLGALHIGKVEEVALSTTPSPTLITIDQHVQRLSATGFVLGGGSAYLSLADSTNAGLFSPAEKTKLAALVANYKGVFSTLANLQTAFPTSTNGDWAIVTNPAGPSQHYTWDGTQLAWESVDFNAITGQTNLGYTPSPLNGVLTSDTGADALIPLADVTNAGLLSPAEKASIADMALNKVEVRTTHVITVVPAGGDIQAAINDLTKYRFIKGALGIIVLDNGIHPLSAPLSCAHPQADAVQIQAIAVNTPVLDSELTGVRATDEALIRSRYTTIIECTSGFAYANFGSALKFLYLGIVDMNAVPTSSAVSLSRGSKLQSTRCSFVGFTSAVSGVDASLVDLADGVICHTSSHGINASYQTIINAESMSIAHTGGYGILMFNFCLFHSNFTKIHHTASSGILAQLNSAIYTISLEIYNAGQRGVQLDMGSGFYGSSSIIRSCTNEAIIGNVNCTLRQYSPTFALNDGAAHVDVFGELGSTFFLDTINSDGGILRNVNVSTGQIAGVHTGAPVFDPPIGTVSADGSRWI